MRSLKHCLRVSGLRVSGLKVSVLKVWVLMVWAAAAVLFGQDNKRPGIDVQDYQIEAEVNPRTQSLTATAAIRFLPTEENTTYAIFELNNALRVSKAVDGAGRDLSASRNQQDYTVRVNFPEPLPKGKAETVVIRYDGRLTGTEESPVYGVKFASIQADYSFLLYPARWFPVNGYTTDRFAAHMKISVPDGFRVVASGLETKGRDGANTVFEFEHTRPSFPGSVAIVKGEANRTSAEGVTTLLYFRSDSADMAGPYGQEIGKVMTFLTSLFGIPPQANLTVVETEAGAPNGYSAPGILFLNPRAIGKSVNTRLLVNQVARQWWGNNVSPTTRAHMWLVNGGARMAELLWVESQSGAGAYETEMKDVYVEALTIDDIPVIQTARLEDYSPEYWAVSGAKGTAVLGMLRYSIGDDKFKTLLTRFLEANAGKSVNTDDFRKAAEQVSERNLQGFFVQWIESSGAPEFKLEYTVFRTTNGFRIMGKVSQDLDTFRMPVDLLIETEGNPETKQVEVVGTSSEFVVETFGRPKKVTIDPNNRVLRYSNQMRVAVAIRRGEMFAEVSEFGDALKEYQKALDVNRNSSLAHYRVAELFFLQRNYQAAANSFRDALNGDLEPKWTEVWAHINVGKIFDITGQRERAINEYNLAIRTKDNTQNAQEEAAKYLKAPYERPASSN
ncbi:MAG: peptidase M1 [Bryobacterales bacterium]|nr:peptidase M1 [Bryobacterales bacterium]